MDQFRSWNLVTWRLRIHDCDRPPDQAGRRIEAEHREALQADPAQNLFGGNEGRDDQRADRERGMKRLVRRSRRDQRSCS
jgi:hypothetical protein